MDKTKKRPKKPGQKKEQEGPGKGKEGGQERQHGQKQLEEEQGKGKKGGQS